MTRSPNVTTGEEKRVEQTNKQTTTKKNTHKKKKCLSCKKACVQMQDSSVDSIIYAE